MVREDLVEGAITCTSGRPMRLRLFSNNHIVLQDPSVASAPIDQRVAFLRSKNLTQEEIDVSLSRVGQASSPTDSQPPPSQYWQPPQQYGNGYQSPQQYPPYWQQPPPEVPRRDWRDWFIAATVMGGAGYALFLTAKRYVYPLIAPPTPPQLEQDKAGIDSSFDKAFALLDQLAADTRELKESEAARKERLDSALAEVENVVNRMKQVNEERDTEAKRMAREINEIRDQIPRAIEKDKEVTDNRIKELGAEMKSLKTLVANRMAGGAPQRTTPTFGSQPQILGFAGAPSPVNGTGMPQTSSSGSQETATTAYSTSTETNGVNGVSGLTMADEESNSASSRTLHGGDRSGAGSPYSRLLGGKAAIPSWQLAAKKNATGSKSEESLNGTTPPTQNLSTSGTVSDAMDGSS